MGGRLHGTVVCSLGIPDTEPAMVLGGETAIGHAGRLRCPSPLMTVKMCWSKSRDWHIRIGPVFGRIGWHVVVDEHTKTQINECLLQLMQRLLLSRCPKSRYPKGEKKESPHISHNSHNSHNSHSSYFPIPTKYPRAFRGCRKSPLDSIRNSRDRAPALRGQAVQT